MQVLVGVKMVKVLMELNVLLMVVHGMLMLQEQITLVLI
jgi:hypothetical protein